MFTVTTYMDHNVAGVWGCGTPEAPALHLSGTSLLRLQIEEDGCELHHADIPIAVRLHREWQLDGPPPTGGTYKPSDGVNFLLALYATYSKGSRMRAVARRQATKNEDSQP